MTKLQIARPQADFSFEKESVFEDTWERFVTIALIVLGFASVILFGSWWFEPTHIPQNFSGAAHVFDFVLFAVLTLVVWYQIVMEALSWEVALFMKKPVHVEPKQKMRVALCTAFVPGKEPYDVLERTLRAMLVVDYVHDTWLLDEGDDEQCKQLCQRLGVRHFTRFGKAQYNTAEGTYKMKTKAGNYNAWFNEHGSSYDIVAQHDVDFRPRRDYLTKTLGYFRDPDVAFVGTPQIYGNEHESWIAKGASEQAYGFYGAFQRGLFGHDMHLFIGANRVIRSTAHDDIMGYAGHIVEDHLTGMRLYEKKWKSVYLPEAVLVGEGPATWSAYFNQQMRWAYGLMDILFRHIPEILPRMNMKHALHYVFLQQYYFYGLAQALGICLMSLYFFFGLQSTSMDLSVLLLLYLTFVAMHLSIFFWLQRFYIAPAEESGFHVRGKLLSIAAWPIYFIAFVSALIGTKITYEVTPKGAAQDDDSPLSLFSLHFLMGTITAIGLIVGLSSGRAAPMIVFWAILNTTLMYGFILHEVSARVRTKIKTIFAHIGHRAVSA